MLLRVSLPAKMSCKLWLNVWTCRSFTCPFTLRNLDRNPTAALISGFIVPRAQRVCIEKGNGDDACAFVVFPSVCPTVQSFCQIRSSDPYLWALGLFLLAFISRGRGDFSLESPCARTVQCWEIDACCW